MGVEKKLKLALGWCPQIFLFLLCEGEVKGSSLRSGLPLLVDESISRFDSVDTNFIKTEYTRPFELLKIQ